MFGLHNPTRVHAICYATTPSDRSVHRQQIEREAPVFRDISNWSPDKIAEQITRDHVHILVNLNGYTRGARNEVFAARPAPIQMSFMGFAGSLGAEWCDYILADTTAIPPSTLRPWRSNVKIEDVFHDNTDGGEGDWMYSENIIFCRDTFFCCDHAQSCGSDEKGMTWEGEKRRRWSMRKKLFPSLSDEVVIMGNFNQLYKVGLKCESPGTAACRANAGWHSPIDRLSRLRSGHGSGSCRRFQMPCFGSSASPSPAKATCGRRPRHGQVPRLRAASYSRTLLQRISTFRAPECAICSLTRPSATPIQQLQTCCGPARRC